MNVSRLIVLDNAFKPVYHLLSGLKSLFSSAHRPPPEQYVVVKFFGMGSIARILYVLDRTDLDQTHITFVTLKKNQTLLNHLGIQALYIDTQSIRTLCVTTLNVLRTIWKQKRTLILDMERTSNLAGIFRIILSLGKPSTSFNFGTHNQQQGNQRFIALHEKPALKAIAEMFGRPMVEPAVKTTWPKIENQIMVNINAGEYLPERRFPSAQYAPLIAQLHRTFPHWNFLLTGIKSETKRVREFKEKLMQLGVPNDRIQDASGKLSLTKLILEIKNSKILITNDSGPLHLAQLFRTPTVAIWGPTAARLVGYPNSEWMLNLNTQATCSPCFLHPKSSVAKSCAGQITCFQTLSVNEMISDIKQFIHTIKTPSKERILP